MDAVLGIVMRASEILAAVRQHHKLVYIFINIIVWAVLVILTKHVWICCFRSMGVMDLFNKGRTYGALQHMIFPLTVDIAGDGGADHAEKCAGALIAIQ